MSSHILYCKTCDAYTMSRTCEKCGNSSTIPHPPRFSPEDRYGKYRRDLMAMSKKEE